MITVSFFENESGKVVKVRSSGHSGYAKHGDDIVCAAVSALVQTAYLAVKDLGTTTDYVADADKGLFEFTTEPVCEKRHDIDVILRALRVGLNDLQSGFGKNVRTETIQLNGGI